MPLLDLPNELLLHIIEAGEISNFRLRSLRFVNRRFDDVIFTKLFVREAIQISFNPSGELSEGLGSRNIWDLAASEALAQLRKGATKLKIFVDGDLSAPHKGRFPKSLVRVLLDSIPRLVEVCIELRVERWPKKYLANTTIAVPREFLHEVMRICSEKRVSVHLNLDLPRPEGRGGIIGTVAKKFLEGLAGLPYNFASLEVSENLHNRKVASGILELAQISQDLRALRMHCCFYDSSHFLMRLTGVQMEQLADRITSLELGACGNDHTASSGGVVTMIRRFPKLLDLTVGDVAPWSLNQSVSQAFEDLTKANRLQVLRASVVSDAMLRFLQSPAGTKIVKLELSLVNFITGWKWRLEERDSDKLAARFWAEVLPSLSGTLRHLLNGEIGTDRLLPSEGDKWTGYRLIRCALAWSPSAYTDVGFSFKFRKLQSFGCILFYNSPGKFNLLMHSLADHLGPNLRKLHIIVLLARVPELDSVQYPFFVERWQDVGGYSWHKKIGYKYRKEDPELAVTFVEEVESSEEGKDILPLDLEMRLEGLVWPYHGANESRFLRDYILLETGWQALE